MPMIKRNAQKKPSKARQWFTKKVKKIAETIKTKDNKQDGQQEDRPKTAVSSVPKDSPSELSVTVAIRFQHPLETVYTYQYGTSPEFRASDRVAHRLLRHIHHCSYELITRQDRIDNDPLLQSKRRIKLAQYHISYRIERDGERWAERYFTSFQEDHVTLDESRRIVLEVDHIVALFLQQHDPGFRWSVPQGIEEDRSNQANDPVMAVIPKLTSHPGYTIELSVRGLGPSGDHERSLRIDSLQSTPLTLPIGETLMTRISGILLQAVEDRRVEFKDQHGDCGSEQGAAGCKHLQEGSFDMMVNIKNNHGPEIPHLSNRIRSFWILFDHDHINILDDFMSRLQTQLEDARQQADTAIYNIDDFVLKINELRTEDWILHDPLTVTLDSSVTDGRRITDGRGTAEAIVQRVQAGIKLIFQGHGVSATLTAHKRGHLMLDTLIHGGEDYADDGQEPFDSPWLNHTFLQARLKNRIREDIEAVCRDTYALDDPFEDLNIKIKTPNNVPQNLHNDLLEEIDPDAEEPPLESRTVVRKPEHVDLRSLSIGDQGSLADTAHDVEEEYEGAEDSDEEDLVPATPSLADTESLSPHECAITPPSKREIIRSSWWSSGLNIVNSDHTETSDSATHSHTFEQDAPEQQKSQTKPIDIVPELQTHDVAAFHATVPDNPFRAHRHDATALPHIKRSPEIGDDNILPQKRRKASDETDESVSTVQKNASSFENATEDLAPIESATPSTPTPQDVPDTSVEPQYNLATEKVQLFQERNPSLPDQVSQIEASAVETAVDESLPLDQATSTGAMRPHDDDQVVVKKPPIKVSEPIVIKQTSPSNAETAVPQEHPTDKVKLVVVERAVQSTNESGGPQRPAEAMKSGVVEVVPESIREGDHADQLLIEEGKDVVIEQPYQPPHPETNEDELQPRTPDDESTCQADIEGAPRAKDCSLRVTIPQQHTMPPFILHEEVDGDDDNGSRALVLATPTSPSSVFSFPLPPSPSLSTTSSPGINRRLSSATTGHVGIRDSRHFEIGLRNAIVPSHLRISQINERTLPILVGQSAE